MKTDENRFVKLVKESNSWYELHKNYYNKSSSSTSRIKFLVFKVKYLKCSIKHFKCINSKYDFIDIVSFSNSKAEVRTKCKKSFPYLHIIDINCIIEYCVLLPPTFDYLKYISDEDLERFVRYSRTYTELCKKVYNTTEKNTLNLKKRIEELGLDTSHFIFQRK